jgi:cytochrome c peroxidase
MGATLGRVLFYDKNLSADNSISCASCHKQDKGFSDDAQLSVGIKGTTTRRNSMTLINSRYYENGRFFWDERAATLEEQVLMPIRDHNEMGLELPAMEQKLHQLDYYPILFRQAFGDEEITARRVALALSQFTRSIISYQSKFDKGIIQAGNSEISDLTPNFPNFTAQENLGVDIFYRGRNEATCKYCHGSAQVVAQEARNNGLEVNYADNGKGEITGNPAHKATFKAPSLRNIALTGPYMHDGRFETLMEVVEHFNTGVQPHQSLHFRLSTIDDGPLGSPPMQMNLNQQEKEALVAFLHTLTDPTIATDPKFSDPFK